MNIAEKTLQLKEDFDEVYEAGKQKEWSDFWDVFQHNGERVNYYYAFYKGNRSQKSIWTDENFKPKYDIKPIGAANNMFYGCNFTDLKSILEKQGVVLDLSGVTGVAQAIFGECYWLTKLPIIDLSNASSLGTTFSYCAELISIDKLILNESGTQTFSSAFNACSKLKDIVIEGVIGQTIDFKACPLTVASLKNIITHLKDYAGTTSEYTYTITFNATAFAELEDEGATSPFGIPWADYIDDLKWNLELL